MTDNNMQKTTFWNFLQNDKIKIEIPIIQRDYAQGRIGKEKLREKFLTDLKSALDGKLLNDEKVLKLDFVYGSVENGCLNPLDGQQRLTTLWLLHWYIAFKAGTLMENNAVFKNFSYETRISSREFCKRLSDFDVKQEGKIVSLIQKQTWFFSVWKQDPTIQAMLHMLGGTTILDENKIDILDGIEEVFVKCNLKDFKDYWEKLRSENCPIIFYYINLFDLKLSDDLYIKMNARGKALTNFENFKADLVGFIKVKGWEDEWKEERINNRLEKDIEEQNEILKDENNPNKTFGHKLDTDWTNVFWINKSNDHKIDDIYFAFINRYFLNWLATAKKADGSYLYTQERLNECSSEKGFDEKYVKGEEYKKLKTGYNTFKTLYGSSSDDSKITYSDYDIYNPKNEEIDVFQKDLFAQLTIILDNFHLAFKPFSKEDINKLFLPSWDSNSDFRFIPEYKKNPKTSNDNNELKYIPTTLTQSQRVVFHSICCYFAKGKYDEYNFKQWIRVVWNIVENANITGTQSMIGAIRLIDDLAYFSHDIYTHLKDRDISKDFAKEQMDEEKEKAEQILCDNTNSWENKIIEAERTAFFNGSIRFLFRTNVNTYDWNNFDKRFEKSKQYFDKKGVTDIYKKDAILLRNLISWFDKWEYFYPWDNHKISFYYDNDISNWMAILTHVAYIVPVNKLFENEVLQIDPSFISPMTDKIKTFHEDLVRTSILTKIISRCTFHWWNHGGYYSLYPYNTKSKSKIFVLADKRNKVLFELEKNKVIIIDTWQKIDDLPYFKGWEISFTSKLNNKKYQWWDSLKEQTENSEWKVVPDVNLDNLEEYLNRY